MGSFWSYLLTFIGGGVSISVMLFLVGKSFLHSWWEKLPTASRKQSRDEKEMFDIHIAAKPHLDDLKNSQTGWLRMAKEYEIKWDGNNMIGLLQETGIYTEQSLKHSKSLVYAILKRETLWLYSDSLVQECQGVLTISQFNVTLCPKYLPDNEVYHVDLPICLTRKTKHSSDDDLQYFLFANTSSEKEDWFLALLGASKMERRGVKNYTCAKKCSSLDFDETAIRQLIFVLHSNKRNSETLWLNALIGRVFLSIHKTPEAKQFVINKILAKIKKIRKPTFLTDLEVVDVDMGSGVPTISHPKLVELNKDGELRLEFFMNYRGSFYVKLKSQAIVDIPTLESLKLNLSLGVTVRELSGRMILRIRSPPTNRFWLGFCEPPSISLDFEPIVYGKQLHFPLLNRLIEKAVANIIEDVLVFPNMDDFPFFNSNGFGGLFEHNDDDFPVPNQRHSAHTPVSTAETHNTTFSSRMSGHEPPRIYINGALGQDSSVDELPDPSSVDSLHHRRHLYPSFASHTNSPDMASAISTTSTTTRGVDPQSGLTQTRSRNSSSPEIPLKKSRKRANSNRKSIFGNIFNLNSNGQNTDINSIDSLILSTCNALSNNRNFDSRSI